MYINLPKNNRRLVAIDIKSSGGVPNTSIRQANCSTSFSPGKSGYPVYSSARMHPAILYIFKYIAGTHFLKVYQPRLHISIAVPYVKPKITSGER